MHKPHLLSAGSIIGDRVTNPDGDDLGRIEEFMIDLNGGHVAYVIVSLAEVVEAGDKLVPVPWGTLRRSADNAQFILEVEKDALAHAPRFGKENWPDMSDARWGAQIYRYFHHAPYWEEYDIEDEDAEDVAG
jgi:sporulation protein YlmC with PRC-barrel domain